METKTSEKELPYLPFGLEILKFIQAENGETVAAVRMRDPAFAWFVENTGNEIAAFVRRFELSHLPYQDGDAWTRDVLTEFYGGVPEDDTEARAGRVAMINAAVPFLCERLRELRERTGTPALLFADLVLPPSGVPSFDDLLHEYVDQERKARRVSERKKNRAKGSKHPTETPVATFRAAVPKTSIMLRSKVANQFEDVAREGVAFYKNGKRGELKNCLVTCGVPDGATIQGRLPYTEFDKAVNDAVTTLHDRGNEIITAEMVARAVFGFTKCEYISPAMTQKIEESIDKQRRMFVTIDYSPEVTDEGVKQTSGKRDKILYLESYLLPADKITATVTGTTKDAYRLRGVPILYEHSQRLKQVASLPPSLLKITDGKGKVVANTERRVAYKRHMLQRIEQMKHGLDSKVISFSSMAEAAGQDYGTLTRKEKHGVSKYARDVLDHFTRKGYIQGYSLKKQGQAITGAEVEL